MEKYHTSNAGTMSTRRKTALAISHFPITGRGGRAVFELCRCGLVLNEIFWLKPLSTKDHVHIPVPYETREDGKTHFMQPLKLTVIKLAQQAQALSII